MWGKDNGLEAVVGTGHGGGGAKNVPGREVLSKYLFLP